MKEREQQEKEEWEGHEEQVERDEREDTTKGKAALTFPLPSWGSTTPSEEAWPAVQRTAATTRSVG